MADYLKSPIFSSPSYWIALGVGVVGIGAAAMQERRGSAARYTVRDRNRPDMIFDPDIPKKITLHSAYFFRDALTESPFEVDTSDARMLNVVRDYLNARGFQFDPVEIESTHEDADEGAHFSTQDRASNLLIAIDEQRGPIEVYSGNHGKMKKIGEVYEGFSASKPTSAKALKSLKKIEGLLLKSRSMGGGSYNQGSAARGGHFGGKTEKEWHDDFFDRYGHTAMERLNTIAHDAGLHYRPKDHPGYFSGMGGTYRSMYERILSGAKRDGIDERAAKAYAAARGFTPEPMSKRRY